MGRGTQAIRSDFQVHTDEEAVTMKDDLQKAQDEQKQEDQRKTSTYASLKGHPGWELIKQDFETTISAYRSGNALKDAIKQGKTMEEIGKLTIVSNAVADELELKVLTVEGAAFALEEDNAAKRTRN